MCASLISCDVDCARAVYCSVADNAVQWAEKSITTVARPISSPRHATTLPTTIEFSKRSNVLIDAVRGKSQIKPTIPSVNRPIGEKRIKLATPQSPIPPATNNVVIKQ